MKLIRCAGNTSPVIIGTVVCTYCHYSTTYRMTPNGLPSHLVQVAAEGEVAGMYCPHCGKNEEGRMERVAMLKVGGLTDAAVGRLTRAFGTGAPTIIEIMPKQAPDIYNIPAEVLYAVAEALGGSAYDSTRCWTAWNVGTMGPSDFTPVQDCPDRVAEIALAAITTWEQSKSGGVA